MRARTIATAAAVALAALTGSARADDQSFAAAVNTMPQHATCAQIVSRLAPTDPRWMTNDGFSLQMILFNDYWAWYKGGQSKIDWSNCNAIAAGMMSPEAESTMMIHVEQLTKKGIPFREALDTIARRWSADPLWESPRPIIPKFDINPWTNKPYAEGATP